MIAALLVALLAQQAPAAAPPRKHAQSQQPSHQQAAPQQSQPRPSTPQPPPAAAPEAPKVQPWQGTLSAGRTELQKLSNAGEHDKAVALGARLLAMPNWNELPEALRADTFFDVGVALGAAKATDAAAELFHRARGLAGSKPLGLDALYDAGTFRLQGAEELRQQIPEIREKLGLQPLPQQQAAQPLAPAGPTGQPTQPSEQPDPLATARAAYVAARADLVERLRCEASDRDTRANLELIQRRLRELDELQKKREEEQKKKQEQQNKDKQDDQQKQDKDKDKQDQKQDQDQQNQDQKDQDKQDQQNKDQQQKDQQQPKPDDSKPGDEDKKQPQPDPKDQQMQPLSPEEVVRLLDQLQKIEEQAEQVRAALRERRRVPVKKDW